MKPLTSTTSAAGKGQKALVSSTAPVGKAVRKKQPKRKVKPGTDASRQEAVRLIKDAILVVEKH